MKIDSLIQGKYQSNDNMNTVKAHEKLARSASESLSYTLDISSKDKDITAYGMEELKSAEDIAAMASTKNVALESDANAVMSNSMSKEDFAEYLKEGYSPSNMEIDEVVTNLDKIKATLLESGVVINGYTDTISDSELDQITGNPAISSIIKDALAENMLPVTETNVTDINNAINKSEEIKPLTDDAKKYLISNDMDTTLDSLYKAEYSSSIDTGKRAGYYVDKTGYTSIRPATSDFDELRSQIEKILSDANLDINDKSLNCAKWLLEKNLPITSENVKALNKINTISIPLKPELVAKSTASAIADGFIAGSADITKDKSLIKKAYEINDEIIKYIDSLSEKDIKNMRTVEEIRLRMSVEANLHLLKKGVSINTKNLENLVENLRNAEKEIYKPLLTNESEKDSVKDETIMERIDLYKSTKSIITNVTNNPLEAVVTTFSSESVFTLDAISKRGDSLRADYDKAGKSYEALMTAPRSDLGDSIKNAFRNIDDILEDLNIEMTKINEKAVRSLAYAGMEINQQNIENAAKANTVVENVISLMSPKKTMELIKNGINPLDMDMYELEGELRKDTPEASDEKYSEFLLRLEKHGEINEQEKEAFIGFYRLFYKIEKSDGKLTGNVLKADEKLTLNNLLVASRSNRTSIDAKVNDDFGFLDKLVTYGRSITDQIMQAFKNNDGNNASSANSDPYVDTKFEELKEAAFFDQDVEKALLMADSNVTTDNLFAMNQLMNNRGNIYKSITAGKKNNDNSALVSRMQHFHDSFSSKDSADEAYENLLDEAGKSTNSLIESADSYVDLRSLKLVNKQISMCSSLKNVNSYEIPVEINGSVTTINVKLIKDEENAGKVNISLCTDEYGKIISEMRLSDNNASMFVICENNAGTDYMKSIEDSVKAKINSSGMKINTIYYSNKADININTAYTAAPGVSDRTPTSDLYNLAKAFITAVHGSKMQ